MSIASTIRRSSSRSSAIHIRWAKTSKRKWRPNVSRKPSLLERVRAVKVWAYSGIRNYFRDQLKEDTRVTFNHKFRAEETARRVPLNVADYARVPLLNPSQLVTSWREPLPSVTNYYDRRMIPLGKRESGVYLVEAVGGDLRAYTVVVVTDLAMVEKASGNGDLLVYAVDRKTGEPRADARVEIVKSRNTIASGRTNSDGIFRTKIPTEDRRCWIRSEKCNTSNFVILASHQDNFAISDLESFYFSGFGEARQRKTFRATSTRIARSIVPITKSSSKEFFVASTRGNSTGPSKRKLFAVTVYDARRRESLRTGAAAIENRNIQRRVHARRRSATRNLPYRSNRPRKAARPAISMSPNTRSRNTKSTSLRQSGFVRPATKQSSTSMPVISSARQSQAPRSSTTFIVTRYYPYFDGENEETVLRTEQDAEQYSGYGNYYSDFMNQGDGKLDASGHFEIEFEVPASQANDVTDYQYRLEAQITDSSRRTIDGSATLIATRGSVIASAMPDRYVFNQGQTARITVRTTDYEGHPVPAKLTLKFVSTADRQWKDERIRSRNTRCSENELSSAEISTDQQGHAIYDFPINNTGEHLDQNGGPGKGARSSFRLAVIFWVVSPDYQWPDDSPYYSESTGSIKLVR